MVHIYFVTNGRVCIETLLMVLDRLGVVCKMFQITFWVTVRVKTNCSIKHASRDICGEACTSVNYLFIPQ